MNRPALDLDLEHTPFSRRGSFFAVSSIARPGVAGTYLRTVRGGVEHREILRLVVDGTAAPSAEAEPGRLELTAGGARVVLALDGTSRALLQVHDGPLLLQFCATQQYDAVLQTGPSSWRFVDSGANRNYLIRVTAGDATFSSRWDGVRNLDASLEVRPGRSTGPALITIDEFGSAAPTDESDFDLVVSVAERDFERWRRLHAPGDRHVRAARLAAWVTWGALVPAGGFLRRESMLMSKNWMTHVWSWDHCFNAMALHRDPEVASDQLLTLFDHQDRHGCLPDFVDDAGIERNFVKPPIHGWTIGYLLDRGGLPDRVVREIYEPLERWTNWWFEHRVYGSDGVPSYNHGNDSGWDNATVFGVGVPVQSPDLLAFLALQMHTLARLALRLDRPGDAARWTQQAERTTHRMIEHFWRGDHFVARSTATGTDVDSESLITLMPLVLGDRLPSEVFAACIRRLVDGGYLTEHGPATEPVHSLHYEADGYWRGPIWAPTTLLLVDGVRRGGLAELADSIAARFLRTCAEAGMAENFDARTGAGLRDRSMTWTASVFLALVADVETGDRIGAGRPEGTSARS